MNEDYNGGALLLNEVSPLNLENIGQQKMAEAFSEDVFANPFMEAWLEVQASDLQIQDVLAEVHANPEENNSENSSFLD